MWLQTTTTNAKGPQFIQASSRKVKKLLARFEMLSDHALAFGKIRRSVPSKDESGTDVSHPPVQCFASDVTWMFRFRRQWPRSETLNTDRPACTSPRGDEFAVCPAFINKERRARRAGSERSQWNVVCHIELRRLSPTWFGALKNGFLAAFFKCFLHIDYIVIPL